MINLTFDILFFEIMQIINYSRAAINCLHFMLVSNNLTSINALEINVRYYI